MSAKIFPPAFRFLLTDPPALAAGRRGQRRLLQKPPTNVKAPLSGSRDRGPPIFFEPGWSMPGLDLGPPDPVFCPGTIMWVALDPRFRKATSDKPLGGQLSGAPARKTSKS